LLSLRSVGYACPQNAHLRRVNSAFSGFASLEIPLVIQLLTKMGVSKNLLDTPYLCFTSPRV